jgi:glycosyltransferase involved in cell wall biosynthesis
LSKGGLVYRTDEELLEHIERLASRPELRRSLGDSGYNAFVQHWSREAHLERYFDILQQAAVSKLGSVPWEMDLPAEISAVPA